MPVGVIGLGGTGKYITNLVISKAQEAGRQDFRGLVIDIDTQDYHVDSKTGIIETYLKVDDLALLVEKSLEADPYFKEWWVNSYYATGRLQGSTGANQVRINGKLALYHNYDKINNAIEKLSEQLSNIEKSPEDKGSNIHYFVVTSIGGGTGAGILVDFLFTLRKMVGEKATIYGVFIDGTVTQRWQDTLGVGQSFFMSFAALTEIEYWIQNSENYIDIKEKRNPEIKHPVNVIFLIQDRTSDGKTFNFAEIGELKRAYCQMAADFIYTFGISQNTQSYLEANELKMFDNIVESAHTEKIPSIRYGSFAITHLTFDSDKAASYLASKFFEEEILKISSEKIEFDFGIPLWEHTDTKLSDHLRDHSTIINSMRSKITEAQKALNNVMYGKIFEIQGVVNRYQLPPSSRNTWINYREKIEKEISDALSDISLRVKEIINTQLEKYLIDKQADIDSLLDSVEVLGQNIQKSIDYIDRKYAVNEENEWRNIENLYKNLIRTRGKSLIVFKSGERARKMEAYKNALNHYISNVFIRSILNKTEKKFYEELKEIVDAYINALRIMRDNLMKARTKIKLEKSSYTTREIPLDSERGKLGEYLFNMKFDLNIELLENLYKDILSQIDVKDQRRLLYQGKGDRLKFSSILSYLVDLAKSKKYEELNESNMLEKTVLKYYDEIKNLITEHLYRQVDIVTVVESFLRDQVYPEVEKLKGMPVKLEEWKNKWSVFFGEKTAGELIKETTLSDPNEWVKTAFVGLLLHVANLMQPFAQYNETNWKTFIEKHYKGYKDKLQRKPTAIVLPANFKHREALGSGETIKLETASSGISNSIDVYSLYFGFPLCVLTPLKNFNGVDIAEKYRLHREKLRKALLENKTSDELPWHTDRRFYTEPDWEIDITSETIVKRIKSESRWVLTFGIAFEIIRRDQRKWVVGRKKISTFPKLIEELEKNDDLRNAIKKQIRDKLQEIYIKLDNKDLFKSKLDEHMRYAFGLLQKVKFPKTAGREEQYKEWEEIIKSISYDEFGNRTPTNSLPTNYEDALKLFM